MSLEEVTTAFLLCGCGLNVPQGTDEQVHAQNRLADG